MQLRIAVLGCLFLSVMPVMGAAMVSPQNEKLHLDWLDSSVMPGENFFDFANGGWQKQNPIPAHYASWGTFYILNEDVQKKIHQMLIEASQNKSLKPDSIEQKIGDFYFSGMDEASINNLGIKPLQSEFDRIEAIKSVSDLQDVITHLQSIGVNAVFNFGSMQNFLNSKEMIGAGMQGGLGLPDRDYYLKEDTKFAEIRDAYVKHMARMFELLRDTPSNASQAANVVMGLETVLAKASLSQIEQRDPHAIYHMMNLTELNAITPHFSWPRYFNAIHLEQLQQINLGMPVFFRKLDEMLQQVSLDDWKMYLRWHLVQNFAPYLSTPFVDEQFQMSKVINGTKKLLPRWQRVVNAENEALGFAIGKQYVEKHFPASSKQAVLAIVKNVRKALRNDIKTLPWMTPKTRQAALKKLDLMKDRVGYPSKWWDYSTLMIDRGPYVLNVKRAKTFLFDRDCNKIGKPVDETEWAMTPQTVNAYYDPSMNNINIPAGILQSPFFDPSAPAAVNYGGIGFVIGHEMTHGFDDEGAQFDGDGNLKNWWTPEDLKKFQASTSCIMNQFSSYKVNGDLSVQGKLVMGEAAADLGGVTLAYRAFMNSDAYKTAKTIDGYTPEQQFFLGMAHVWAMNIRPEKMRDLITTDPHPPAIYRINGTLANMPAFQAAFSLPNKSPMVNKNRCIIW